MPRASISRMGLALGPLVARRSTHSAAGGGGKPGAKASVVLEYKPRSQAGAAAAPAAQTAQTEAGAGSAGTKAYATAVAVVDGEIPYSQQPPEVQKRMYKKAAGKWTRGMISLPILIMSSYWLFDRLVLGNEKKEFPESWRNPPAAPGVEATADPESCDAVK